MSYSAAVGNFLVQYENEILFICLFGTLFLSAVAETFRPRRTQKREQLSERWPVNLGLLLINQVNAVWLIALSVLLADWWSESQNIELATYFELGFWSSVLLAFGLFELINYWFHRLLHAVPLLWRIHAIHHCDREVDFSTTFRNHPLELLIIAPITIPIVVFLGFTASAVVLYQALRSVLLVFAHSNVYIPGYVDRYLRWFITTPDYHRIHHSSEREFTDSNFAPIFPVYDYLFGTYKARPYSELESMDIGLEYMHKSSERTFFKLLLAPFIWNYGNREENSTVGVRCAPYNWAEGSDVPRRALRSSQ